MYLAFFKSLATGSSSLLFVVAIGHLIKSEEYLSSVIVAVMSFLGIEGFHCLAGLVIFVQMFICFRRLPEILYKLIN